MTASEVARRRSSTRRAPAYSISALVAGQEKFLIMVLGAIAVYVQATTYITDQNLKNLITAVIVAAQGWLGTNSGSVQLEEGEVVADKEDVAPGAGTKPPARELPVRDLGTVSAPGETSAAPVQ